MSTPEITAVRERIAETQAQITELENAPLPVSDARESARRTVERMAAKVAETGIGRSFFAADGFAEDPIRGIVGAFGQQPDALGPLLAWLYPDALLAALGREIDAAAAGMTSGPPLAKRPPLRKKLEKDLYQLGVEEERLIVAAEAAGTVVYRRPDVDPAIVLAVDGG